MFVRAIRSCSVLIVATLGVARADVLKVPQDLATIQAAVDVANAGDVIVVSAGKYTGNVSINAKTDLVVRAKGDVEIDGVVALLPTPAVVVSNCTRVTLRGLRVKCPDNVRCITVSSSTDCRIDRCEVRGGDEGIDAVDVEGAIIDRCRVDQIAANGILMAAGHSAVTRCTIRRCGADGIRVIEGLSIDVRGNRIDRCEQNGIDIDVGTTRALVNDNVVRRAKNFGIFFAGSMIGGEIIGNRVSDGGIHGLKVFGDAIAVVDNRITAVDGPGLGVFSAGALTLGNRVTRCDVGLEIHPEATDATHIDNRITRSTTIGVRIDVGTTGNLLSGNSASKSGDFDFVDETAGANALIDNRFKTIGP